MIIQNKDYTPGLALDRHGVSKVCSWWLWGSLLDEDHLLVLLDYLLVLWLARGHELYQLVIYIHEMMMQHLIIRQQLLK